MAIIIRQYPAITFCYYFRSETLCKGCTENQRMHGTAASKRFSLQCIGTFYLQRSEHDKDRIPADFAAEMGIPFFRGF